MQLRPCQRPNLEDRHLWLRAILQVFHLHFIQGDLRLLKLGRLRKPHARLHLGISGAGLVLGPQFGPVQFRPPLLAVPFQANPAGGLSRYLRPQLLVSAQLELSERLLFLSGLPDRTCSILSHRSRAAARPAGTTATSFWLCPPIRGQQHLHARAVTAIHAIEAELHFFIRRIEEQEIVIAGVLMLPIVIGAIHAMKVRLGEAQNRFADFRLLCDRPSAGVVPGLLVSLSPRKFMAMVMKNTIPAKTTRARIHCVGFMSATQQRSCA